MATVYLSPIGNGAQFFTAGGLPLNAGLITTYIAGTTTPQSTYTSPSGAISNANPIVLGADGRTTQEIWLTQGIAYKFILTDSLSNLLGTYDNLSGINDPTYGSLSTEWLPISTTPTYISATQFTMPNNQTLIFTANRRVQVFVSAGTLYGTVVSSVFGGSITTVTVLLDSGALDSGLLTANVGILNAVNQSMPTALTTLASINGSWPSGFKNKLIGGDFTTNPWQRGTSFPGATTGSYYADRWLYGKAGTAVHSILKVIDAPTVAQSGVYATSCIALNVATAETPILAGDYCILQQSIEGYNAAPFGFGQPGAKNVTLSFWVKGAKTGIHCVALRNSASNRSYVAEYTIIGITTWEYKTITIPVDVAGAWTYDNSAGVLLAFCLASGSTLQTTSNSWQTGNFISTANQVNELDTVNNTFKLALVQLETGSTATQFEARSVGQEFTLCQRYYQTLSDFMANGNNLGGTGIFTDGVLSVPMRATPTATVATAITYANASGYTFNGVTTSKFRITLIITATGYGYGFGGLLTFSAEL